jgi:outer membrane immunogenic protein
MNATRALRASVIAALLAVIPASVFAADLPARKGPAALPPGPPPLPYYNWTGFYVGGNLGGLFESDTVTDAVLGTSLSASRSGFIGGGQVGYNWQFAPWGVVGVEWMFDGTSLSSTDTDLVNMVQANEKVDWITTIAGRLGFAANNWLFYGKGGGGWVHDRLVVSDLDAGNAFTASQTSGGWLAGAGIEYGITRNWTVRVDYSHIGLGSVTEPGIAAVDDVLTFSRHFDIVTAGVNYRF